MITKKQLKARIEVLEKCIGSTGNIISELIGRIEALEQKKADEADVISGPEAAKMLGWQSGYVSSTWLDKVGIKYSKGDNGCLKISHKAVEEYLESRKTTTED